MKKYNSCYKVNSSSKLLATNSTLIASNKDYANIKYACISLRFKEGHKGYCASSNRDIADIYSRDWLCCMDNSEKEESK